MKYNIATTTFADNMKLRIAGLCFAHLFLYSLVSANRTTEEILPNDEYYPVHMPPINFERNTSCGAVMCIIQQALLSQLASFCMRFQKVIAKQLVKLMTLIKSRLVQYFCTCRCVEQPDCELTHSENVSICFYDVNDDVSHNTTEPGTTTTEPGTTTTRPGTTTTRPDTTTTRPRTTTTKSSTTSTKPGKAAGIFRWVKKKINSLWMKLRREPKLDEANLVLVDNGDMNYCTAEHFYVKDEKDNVASVPASSVTCPSCYQLTCLCGDKVDEVEDVETSDSEIDKKIDSEFDNLPAGFENVRRLSPSDEGHDPNELLRESYSPVEA